MTSTKSASPAFEEIRTSLRRAQILAGATQVFSAKGYHRATTKDIAQAAGLAEGTLYNYFENKAELLIALIENFDLATTQTPDLIEGLDLSLRALLIERLKNDLSQLDPHFDMLMAILPEVLVDPALRAMYYERLVLPGLMGISEHLQIRQELGEIDVANIPMTTRIFVAAMLGLQMLHILGDQTVRDEWKKPQELAENIALVVIDGLNPSKW